MSSTLYKHAGCTRVGWSEGMSAEKHSISGVRNQTLDRSMANADSPVWEAKPHAKGGRARTVEEDHDRYSRYGTGYSGMTFGGSEGEMIEDQEIDRTCQRGDHWMHIVKT